MLNHLHAVFEDPDPDPVFQVNADPCGSGSRSGYGSRILMAKNWRRKKSGLNFFLFLSINWNFLISRSTWRTSKLQEMPSALKKEHPALKKIKFINCFLFFWAIFAILDPDPDCESGSTTLFKYETGTTVPEDSSHLVEHPVHPGAHLLCVIRHQGVHRSLVQHHAVDLVLINDFLKRYSFKNEDNKI